MKRLKENISRNNFEVPDGYFENFHDRLMQRLPQSENGVKRGRVIAFDSFRNWSYAAAITIAFIMGGIAFYSNETVDTAHLATSEEYSSDYIDDLLENYRIDDYMVYSYLTSSETGF